MLWMPMSSPQMTRMLGFLSAAPAEGAARSEAPSNRAQSQSGRSAEAFMVSPRSWRCVAARFTHAVCRISWGGGPPLLKRVMVGEKQKRLRRDGASRFRAKPWCTDQIDRAAIIGWRGFPRAELPGMSERRPGSRAHGQDHPKARPPAQHLLVSLRCLLQRIALDHRPDSGERAERQGVLGVLRGAGRPAMNGAAGQDDLQRVDGQRLRRDTDHDELAAGREAIYQGRDGLGVRSRGEDRARAAELLQSLRRSAHRAVDVIVCTQLPNERVLVGATTDGRRAEAHLAGALDAEMAEAADALHGDQIAWSRSRVAQGIVDGHPGAEQWGRLRARQIVGHRGNRLGGGDHVLGVAAVEAERGDLLEAAQDEVAAAARITRKAVSTVPADTDALTGLPDLDVGAHDVDAPRDLVPRDARVREPGPEPILDEHVAVTDAAGLDLDAHLMTLRVGNRTLHELEVTARLGHLDRLHGWHCVSSATESCPANACSEWKEEVPKDQGRSRR